MTIQANIVDGLFQGFIAGGLEVSPQRCGIP